MYKILLVDDEINVLHALQRSLRQLKSTMALEVTLCTDPKEAIEQIAQTQFDFIIADYHMPQLNGVDFLRIAKEMQPDTVRMMLSASADFTTIMSAVNEAEVFRYLTKPWEKDELEKNIHDAVARRDQLLNERQYIDEGQMLLGEIDEQEIEARRLERLEPGITKVRWNAEGAVLLDGINDDKPSEPR
ncbi:MAG: response regulator [Burkholderiaceae bacterium]|nr:response regulator [Burkholderiaceae bacterium]